ncbi:hypothetical protein RclHR1_00970032 [Rhizophagus clarus]|uniref:Uncharacterized protein n=1 Tax=Rhizophagus clarus TaxID=94130 RepID=A0A2Z6S7D5_9GLOM|nr:hypothetical protein RclHR1_00970032 [Rhizophagus clarus]
MSYFKKFGNIASCRVYSRKNAKVQQARIVYDSAHSIARFDTQWAVYCFSTCLRVTPCHYTVNQKSSHREFVTTLTQLPPNTKDIDLAPLTRDLGAKANLPNNTNKLCHRCGKLSCAPNQCLSRQQRGRTRDKNPVAALRERFNINQPTHSKARSRSGSRSRSRSQGPDSSRSSHPRQVSANVPNVTNPPQHERSQSVNRCDRSVFFFTTSRTPSTPFSRNPPITMSPQEAADILSLLKGLQADMAEVWDRITALELNDKCMTRIEQHLGLSLPDVVVTAQSSDMLIDPPDHADLIVALVSSKPAVTTAKLPLNPLVPGFTPSRPPVKAPISASPHCYYPYWFLVILYP